MKRFWVYCLALVLPVLSIAQDDAATDSTEQLYYAVERDFSGNRRWEARAALAYDFSNPYVHLLGGQGTMLWSASPFLAFGVEGSVYSSTMRTSAVNLQEELKRHGYKLRVLSPDYGVVGVVRFTPVSGLMNFFSSNVMQADVSLLLRGGATSYSTLGWGPTVGTGFEVNLRSQSGLGVLAALVFDWDRIDSSWQTRTGFRVGPTYRF